MVVSQQDLDHILNHTGSIWEHFNDRNLFITGGTGFFGKWILECLVHATKKMNIRTKVFILSRNPTLFLKKYPHYSELPFIEFVKGDIVNFEFFSKQIDYVIHAATDVDAKLNVEYPLTMLDTIVNGTRRVLDYALFCNARRVLLTSSGAVYGRLPADISHVEEGHMGGPDPLGIGCDDVFAGALPEGGITTNDDVILALVAWAPSGPWVLTQPLEVVQVGNHLDLLLYRESIGLPKGAC